MNADPSHSGAGGEENSWETLAEDLFGIDLGAKGAGQPLVGPEDLALDDAESPLTSAKAAKGSPEAAEPPAGPAPKQAEPKSRQEPRMLRVAKPQKNRIPAPEEDDFGADLGLDDPEAGDDIESDFEVEEEVIAETDAESVAPGQSTAETPEERREQRSEGGEDDSYWDPLKTWQWGEEEGEPSEHRERPPGGRGGRGGGGPRRSGGRERSGSRERSGGRERRPQEGGGPRSRRPGGRSENRSEGRGEGRRSDQPQERRPEERPRRPPVAPDRPVPDEPDDFGAGLLEGSAIESSHGGSEPWDIESPIESRRPRQEFAESEEIDSAEEGPESTESTESERPPRRRRRRRRSRPRRERPGEPVERQDRAESADESRIDDEVEVEDEPAGEFLSDEDSTEESGAEREVAENRPPRRRRRRRRRPGERGPRREDSADEPLTDLEADEEFRSEAPLRTSSAADDEDEGVDAEGELEGDDDEAPRVYRNVPTWEEAISYLLHRPGDSGSRERDSGGPREQRRDSGRRPDRGERSHD